MTHPNLAADNPLAVTLNCFLEYMRHNFAGKGDGVGFLVHVEGGSGVVVYFVNDIFNYREVSGWQVAKTHVRLEPTAEADKRAGRFKLKTNHGQLVIHKDGAPFQVIEPVPGREANLVDLVRTESGFYIVSVCPKGPNSALYVYNKTADAFEECVQ